jgi:hypothetical protein
VEFSSQLCAQLDTLTITDFSSGYENFSKISHEILDQHAPVITKSIVHREIVPWQDSEYRNERALRRNLERKWRKTGNQDGPERRAYIAQRSKCANLASLKHSQYLSNLIQNSEGDQSSIYKIVTQILDKKKSVTLPQFDNQPVKLANRFNSFFIDKVKNLRDKIPAIDSSVNFDNSQVDFNGTFLDTFDPVTVDELKDIMKGRPVKTAYNDILPRPIMRAIIENLLPYICDLINISLQTGSMDGVKGATIVPLLKKSGLDPEVLKNYRPVNDIVLISKLIERVVLKRLNAHSTVNDLHCDYQHGYKKYHSTETLLIKVVNDILVGFDSNNATILLLLDLSAAFDTVDIGKLLLILKHEYGIRHTALKWFHSFLYGRTQRVRINSSLSTDIDVIFGVPQGSVLGPVLFNIYIHSLYNIICKAGFSASGYADDSNARLTFSLCFQNNVLTQELPKLMDKITQMMNDFFLKINPDKTEIILFIPPSLKNVPSINGTFFGPETCIRFSDTVTNLGVKLDRFLNFEPYVNATVSLCYKLIKDVASVRNLISKSQTEMLVHSIITSRLDYCNSLLYNVNNCVINKFQKVQNAAARVILKLRKFQSVRNELVNLHWLRINERITFKLLVLTFKCMNDMAPVELSALLHNSSSINRTLHYTFMDTVYGRRSFQYVAPRLWNALPFTIRSSNSLENFKSKIKYHLFNHYSEFMRSVNRYL